MSYDSGRQQQTKGEAVMHFRITTPLRSWDDVRLWLVVWSTLVTGLILFFFVAAPYIPVIGVLFQGDKSKQAAGVICPVFFGYLGLSTSFIFNKNRLEIHDTKFELLYSFIIKGPIILFSAMLLIIVFIYCVTNVTAVRPGDGMGFSSFMSAVSTLMTLLSATTGLIFSKVFAGTDA